MLRIDRLIKPLKLYLRWGILGTILFFLLTTLKNHAEEVASIQITSTGWGYLGLSLFVTLLAHIWSGWVWTWILLEFNQPVPIFWALRIYLTTNMAKYIPGNVWHFYGRILTITKVGVSGNVATVSVLMEPLLMAAAALIITLLGTFGLWSGSDQNGLEIGTYNLSMNFLQIVKVLGLSGVLMGVHPLILNPLIEFLGKSKLKKSQKSIENAGEKPLNLKPGKLQRYPLLPLLGELGFLLLRGSGFLLAMIAMMSPIHSLNLSSVFSALLALGAFSFAWLLGLVVPGAPGGIGIFEATAIALLQNYFTPGVLIGSIAFYRLISVLAEAIGGAISWLIEKYMVSPSNYPKV